MNGDENQIDRLVRRHLDRQAERVDGEQVLRAVRGRMERPGSRRRVRMTRRAAIGAAAASVAGAGLLWFWPAPEASAEELVRDARDALTRQPRDRHYRIETVWEPWMAERFPMFRLPQRAELWTRGDAFWLEKVTPFAQVRSWGRDPAGRLWVTPGPRVCLILEPEHIPEPLELLTDFYRLELSSLLGELLATFRLSRGSDPNGDRVRVRAEPRFRSPRRRVLGLTMLVDPRTKVIHQVVVERQMAGRLAAVVTFDLEAITDLPDGSYDFSDRVGPDVNVVDLAKVAPGLRQHLTRKHLDRLMP